MQDYLDDERLKILLAPFTEQEQRVMASCFEFERGLTLRTLYFLDINELLSCKKIVYRLLLAVTNYEEEATSNIFYLMFEPAIECASLTLEAAADLYAQGPEPLRDGMSRIVDEQFALPQYAHSSEIGKLILERSSWNESLEGYLKRFYDIQGYAALVEAKRQMLTSGVDIHDNKAVTAFIQRRGKAMLHPYTRQTFGWDAGKGLLTTGWVQPYKETRPIWGDSTNERMAVRIH